MEERGRIWRRFQVERMARNEREKSRERVGVSAVTEGAEREVNGGVKREVLRG